MANSQHLRKNKNQHKPKNRKSKQQDKAIYLAMQDTIQYLKKRFDGQLHDYTLTFEKSISFETMIDIIKNTGVRKEFDTVFNRKGNTNRMRVIKPDGGVIFLSKKSDDSFLKVLLIAETKQQGTNDIRKREGKKPQAQGNAIERLGKNLTGIKAMFNHEKITPFVCFGQGCDFQENYNYDSFVMSKISMLNEFYRLNKTYVFKTDGQTDYNAYSPVSMYFREKEWSRTEMFNINKEIAETALRYYIY